MSKSTRGYTEFHPEWLDKEGVLTVIVLMMLPFIVLYIMSKIFPLWSESEEAPS